LEAYEAILRDEDLLTDARVLGHESQLITYLTYNSKDVVPGTLFICKGAAFKPIYLEEAVKNGAVAYVSEVSYDVQVPCLLVKDIRKAMPPMAEKYFNQAWKQLTIAAFGGTKGKSTSAYYMKAIVDDYMAATGGKESAVLSSIDMYDGVIRQESHITTPESVELHEHMRHAVDSGITFMEMEVSSQALKYDRVEHMQFDVAVYLNISEDHISPIEHVDFEDYLSSKMKMFALAKQAVVNLDADFSERALEAAKDAGDFKTFSLKNPSADFYGYDIHKENGEIVFSVRCRQFDETFRLTMPGLFNVENAVAVVAAASLLNIPMTYIKSGLYRARSSGRMELYTSKDKRVTAVVDYAHNKLSFEKLFGSTREEYPNHDIVAIFGCPGYKAYIRRRDLGTIAGMYSKKVYLVAEDPGKEPVQQISEDIAQYVAAQNCPYEIIEDRGVAIHKAILECKRPTVLLITGKGNETRQKYGTIYADCTTDVQYVKMYLEEYDKAPFHVIEPTVLE
jgi:UDP-N-acetylmuramoyl-L-alanyl-D-glutamate--2,6-diaminopimelate ligase